MMKQDVNARNCVRTVQMKAGDVKRVERIGQDLQGEIRERTKSLPLTADRQVTNEQRVATARSFTMPYTWFCN
jgi:hypothetical protein